MNEAIKITNLKKSYDKTIALKGIDISIKDGAFFGLLGPNGAGKTTTINILTGLVNKDSGETKVFNKDTEKDFRFTRSQIGISAQEFSQDWFFSLEKLLYFQAGYFGIRKKDAESKVNELFDKLGLNEKRNSRLRQLSGGMKRRFQIAKALVHDPKIIILDEPTAGVDVEIRQSMWQYLTQLNNDGMTIILTTHYLEEAESLCRNIAILNNGELVEQSNMKRLLARAKRQVIIIDTVEKISGPIEISDCDCEVIDENTLQVSQGEGISISDVVASLLDQNIHVSHLRSSQNRLEALFLSLTS